MGRTGGKPDRSAALAKLVKVPTPSIGRTGAIPESDVVPRR
ncbi:MAG: hypothetical protein Q7T82_01815 [Armatimonadota bacterium]|nr:hypothetical protein [Armatimonadota bacterium]